MRAIASDGDKKKVVELVTVELVTLSGSKVTIFIGPGAGASQPGSSFPNLRPSQKPSQASNMARQSSAYLGKARLSSRPEAEPGTALVPNREVLISSDSNDTSVVVPKGISTQEYVQLIKNLVRN
jgi:hypothetical protein